MGHLTLSKCLGCDLTPYEIHNGKFRFLLCYFLIFEVIALVIGRGTFSRFVWDWRDNQRGENGFSWSVEMWTAIHIYILFEMASAAYYGSVILLAPFAYLGMIVWTRDHFKNEGRKSKTEKGND